MKFNYKDSKDGNAFNCCLWNTLNIKVSRFKYSTFFIFVLIKGYAKI